MTDEEKVGAVTCLILGHIFIETYDPDNPDMYMIYDHCLRCGKKSPVNSWSVLNSSLSYGITHKLINPKLYGRPFDDK